MCPPSPVWVPQRKSGLHEDVVLALGTGSEDVALVVLVLWGMGAVCEDVALVVLVLWLMRAGGEDVALVVHVLVMGVARAKTASFAASTR